MSTPFIGEIKLVSFNFAPRNWALCNGQQLPIAQNQALFSLLGTTYGGNGITTFQLPDLRGRVPMHAGTLGQESFSQGEALGTESVTLTAAQMPLHTHTVMASATGGQSHAANNVLATASQPLYGNATGAVSLNSQSVSATGNTTPQPHTNLQPYLTINFVIALQGLFPSRN